MKNKFIFAFLLLGACKASIPDRCTIPQPLCPIDTHYECHGDTTACGVCVPGRATSCPEGYVLRETLCFAKPK
jgi:hypothetical protein